MARSYAGMYRWQNCKFIAYLTNGDRRLLSSNPHPMRHPPSPVSNLYLQSAIAMIEKFPEEAA
jgi:hypothetical protein